jgi:hypothetical protein
MGPNLNSQSDNSQSEFHVPPVEEKVSLYAPNIRLIRLRGYLHFFLFSLDYLLVSCLH